MLLLTGNNTRVDGDATRRVLTCRLDAHAEQPSLRSFDLEPESYIRENQPQLHMAALTILRGYKSRGAVKQSADVAGSFEDWDRMIRQCVIWIGRNGYADVAVGDPYASAINNMQNDPSMETVLEVMNSIRSVFGDKFESPKVILTALQFQSGGERGEGIDAIDPKLTPQRLGFWLTKHRDRIVGGLQIHREFNSATKTWRYAVFETDKRPSPAEILDEVVAMRSKVANSPNRDLL